METFRRVPSGVTGAVSDCVCSSPVASLSSEDSCRISLPINADKFLAYRHKNATLTHINRYGLVYTLVGASDSLKPIVLAAHQDVVPAGPADKWTHPPFNAYFDGSYLWGRGSSDCKTNLIGILSTVEFLLEKDWKPSRTIVLAFGFDEETGGVRGAAKIGEYLEDTWGKNGIELILDEGGMGLQTVGDYVYARPGVAEKGYTDVALILDTSGGHSSKPPSHSGIGIMAEMIVALEEHPYTPQLTKENPFRGVLECQARYSPDELEPWLRKALQRDEGNIGIRLAKARGQSVRFSMQTSQAVDVINGGVKVNALPESVTTMVNYRVAPHDSLEIVKHNIETYLSPIAHKHNISIITFSTQNTNTAAEVNSYPLAGTLTLRSHNDLSPSPITPTDPHTDAVWRLFSATLRSVFEAVPSLQGKTVIPVGDIMTGNTDTMHYWNLTTNIYRFSPGKSANVHTVDERVEMESHLEGMRLYYDVIRNFDEWTG